MTYLELFIRLTIIAAIVGGLHYCARLRKALEWYSQGMPWDDTVGNLSERAVKALSENILNKY